MLAAPDGLQNVLNDPESMLRTVPVAAQSFSITICLFTAFWIYHLRSTRVMKAANWIQLEVFLFGAILLYSTTITMYFQANDTTCLLRPWLRELGFTVMYGVLFMKIYRVLSSFQSRKAHRVHVRDKDMLKYMGMFVLLSTVFMTAWTCVNLDYIDLGPWATKRNLSMVAEGVELPPRASPTPANESFSVPSLSVSPPEPSPRARVCRALSWDIVIELSEFVLLATAIRYCVMVRSAPSDYFEIRFITVALVNELVLSGALHVSRHFLWYSLKPTSIFLIYFVHSHATVTVNLLVVLAPKVWYAKRGITHHGVGDCQGRRMVANKLNLASNGDIDLSDINLADMDPEVIRVYKNKAMRKDNPHVSKRRGGRKQRRFSLQTFHKKQHHCPQTLIQSDSGSAVFTSAAPALTGSIASESQSAVFPSIESGNHAAVSFQAPRATIMPDEDVSRLSEESVSADEPLAGLQSNRLTASATTKKHLNPPPAGSKPRPV